MKQQKKIIVAITGASGSIYARLLCQKLCALKAELQADLNSVVEERTLKAIHKSKVTYVPAAACQIALIMTDNGSKVLDFEDDSSWINKLNIKIYDNTNMFSAVASGSANYDAMVVIPCSMGTLGRIASGVSSDLIGRAADVMLKERRRLILVTREAPLSTIHLQNMTRLSECGAIICPASPSFYSKPQNIEELCNTIVDRVISLMGIETPHYEWGSEK